MNQFRQTITPKEFTRRAIAVIICLSVPALFVVSLVLGLMNPSPSWFAGSWPLSITALVATINIHTSFLRPFIYQRRSGTMDGYKHVSGIPMVGWIGLILALLGGWSAPGTAILGLLLCFLDTGGLFWFLIAIWRDASFFGAQPPTESNDS